ncbi:60S acidic ribosomal protein P1-3 [Glycine soja]|uniref:60S acidic ribosomal protein P1-3 n=1 Tax=Glycine soja TaxID=3848 RepID=A0A0B2Q8X5_GLYSO|nr:60S acidic ribosomal protein P1-3 [Glycine soja]
MSLGETACSYAALILHEDGISVTADKISTLLKTAKQMRQAVVHQLLLQLPQLLLVAAAGGGAAAAAPAAEEKKKEEPEEESDDDMGFGLFD